MTITKGLVSRDLISPNRPVLRPGHFWFNKHNRTVDSDSRATSEYLKGSKSDDDSRLLIYDFMCRRIGGASRFRLLPPLLHLVTRSISFRPVFFLCLLSSAIRVLQNYGPSTPGCISTKTGSLYFIPHFSQSLSSLTHLKHLFCHPFIFLPSSLTSFGP